MRALIKRSQAAGDAALDDIAEPGPPAAGEVLIEIGMAGICGTDLHIFGGHYWVTPPVVMGHEFVGRVVSAGPGVDPAWIGRRVVGETFFSTCGRCVYCRSGRRNLCRERRSIGTHVDGAFAPILRLPAANLRAVPEDVPDRVAVLAEPLACVVNALGERSPALRPGDRVLVTGPGPIGLVTFLYARAAGCEVTLRGTSTDTDRLAWAAARGATVSVAGETSESAESFDVAVECSGSRQALADALEALAKGGRLVQMGLMGQPIEADWDRICFKELSVTAGFASTPAAWDRAVPLLSQLPLDGLVTHSGGLAEWRGMFDPAQRQGGIKFVLIPGGLA